MASAMVLMFVPPVPQFPCESLVPNVMGLGRALGDSSVTSVETSQRRLVPYKDSTEIPSAFHRVRTWEVCSPEQGPHLACPHPGLGLLDSRTGRNEILSSLSSPACGVWLQQPERAQTAS